MKVAEIARGSHQVYAEVRDENSQVLMRSPTVTFFVQQTSADGNPRTKPLPPVNLPTQPVSRRKTVR
jgi:hypothetical protein